MIGSSSTLFLPIWASRLNKKRLLEQDDLFDKAEALMIYLNQELQLLEVKIRLNQSQGRPWKATRDYFLNQQLKTVQEELGRDPQEQDIEELQRKSGCQEMD